MKIWEYKRDLLIANLQVNEILGRKYDFNPLRWYPLRRMLVSLIAGKDVKWVWSLVSCVMNLFSDQMKNDNLSQFFLPHVSCFIVSFRNKKYRFYCRFFGFKLQCISTLISPAPSCNLTNTIKVIQKIRCSKEHEDGCRKKIMLWEAISGKNSYSFKRSHVKIFNNSKFNLKLLERIFSQCTYCAHLYLNLFLLYKNIIF